MYTKDVKGKAYVYTKKIILIFMTTHYLFKWVLNQYKHNCVSHMKRVLPSCVTQLTQLTQLDNYNDDNPYLLTCIFSDSLKKIMKIVGYA